MPAIGGALIIASELASAHPARCDAGVVEAKVGGPIDMPSRPFRRLQKVGVALSSSGEGGSGNRVISLSALTPIDAVAAMPDEAVRRFQEEGAVMLKSVFSSSWVEVLREAAEANMADPGPLCDEHAAAQGTAGRFHDDQ